MYSKNNTYKNSAFSTFLPPKSVVKVGRGMWDVALAPPPAHTHMRITPLCETNVIRIICFTYAKS